MQSVLTSVRNQIIPKALAVFQEQSCCVALSLFSHSVVPNSFVMPWTVARQARLSLGFSRQEHCSGLPFPAPEDLPDLRIKPKSPALAGRFFT